MREPEKVKARRQHLVAPVFGRFWLVAEIDMQQIIWRDTPRRAGRAQADVTMQRTLRDTLLVQLSGRITPLGETAFDWVRQEEPLWGVDRVLCEASILEAHGDASGAAEILAGAVRQGLVSATGRPAGLVTTSPEAIVVARVLSQLADMTKWFGALWRDTYELREQLSYPAHRGLDNPAYPVIAWGLIGLNSSQATRVDTAEFWRTIGSAVFETQRIDPNANLFNGAMPPITLPLNYLADFLADQLEPTAEYARLWQVTRSEASDATTLARALGRRSHVASGVRSWARAKSSGVRRSTRSFRTGRFGRILAPPLREANIHHRPLEDT
jgi:hypothetical protein